jgi:hypothetical protein
MTNSSWSIYWSLCDLLSGVIKNKRIFESRSDSESHVPEGLHSWQDAILRLRWPLPKQVKSSAGGAAGCCRICSPPPKIIWNHRDPISSDLKCLNPTLFPIIITRQQNLDPNNYYWIWFRGKKSKHPSNCDLLQFPAEVNKLCKHKRLQKILPVLVKTVLNWCRWSWCNSSTVFGYSLKGTFPSCYLTVIFVYKLIGTVNLELGFNQWMGNWDLRGSCTKKGSQVSPWSTFSSHNDALRSERNVLPCKGIGLKEEQRRAHLTYSKPSKSGGNY